MQIVEKEIDKQGRIVLPKDWISSYPKKVILIKAENEMRIVPKVKSNLTKFFDRFPLHLKSDLAHWHDVRRELSRHP